MSKEQVRPSLLLLQVAVDWNHNTHPMSAHRCNPSTRTARGQCKRLHCCTSFLAEMTRLFMLSNNWFQTTSYRRSAHNRHIANNLRSSFT